MASEENSINASRTRATSLAPLEDERSRGEAVVDVATNDVSRTCEEPSASPGGGRGVRGSAADAADERYMRMAIDEARRAESIGEVPIGAVVVYDPIDPATRRHVLPEPRVIARACNLRETTRDPAGHAEFLAMKDASRELGAWRLSGCTVYVTLEPCIMCAGLMHQARVDRCVYGASDPKAGALGTLYDIASDDRLNHTFPVTAGVLADECAALLTGFFANRRRKRTKEKDS